MGWVTQEGPRFVAVVVVSAAVVRGFYLGTEFPFVKD